MNRSAIVHRSSLTRTGGDAREPTRAFTLVETLSALLLGSAVVTVAAVVAVQSVAAQKAVESNLTRQWERVRVFDQFEADVHSELPWLAETDKTIFLPEAHDRLLEILGLSTKPNPGSLFRKRLPAQIAYVIEDTGGEPELKKLIREVRYLTDAQTTLHRETLTDTLLEIRLEQWQETGWTEQRAPRGAGGERPAAVRLLCRWKSRPDLLLTRTVFLLDKREESPTRRR